MSERRSILDVITVVQGKDSIELIMPDPDDYSFDMDDWGQQICKAYPGPYRFLNIDLNRYKSINSVLCAGFIHIYRTYQCEQATLKNVSRNVETILKTLQLNRIFNLEFNTGRFDVLE